MLGWLRPPPARASCSTRRKRSGSFENDAGKTLTATSRPSRGSFARYTSPIPPAPSGETISYRPTPPPEESVNLRLSLDPVQEIQVGQGAQVTVDVRESVRRGQHGGDIDDS